VQAFSLEPGGTATLSFFIKAEPGARAGAHWWALARVACHGTLLYQPSAAIELVEAGD
jgi:hypothetical protein